MRKRLPGNNVLLFMSNELHTAEQNKDIRKGRNPELVERRNEKLADRLYFYRVFGKLDNDTALLILSSEFDIAAFTIAEIAMKKSTYLRNLHKKEITLMQLKKKWPYLNWNNVHPVQ